MQIVPCCMIGNPEVKSLGNAKEFTKNWNNNKYQSFRESHLNNNIENVCKNCYECK